MPEWPRYAFCFARLYNCFDPVCHAASCMHVCVELSVYRYMLLALLCLVCDGSDVQSAVNCRLFTESS